MHLNSGANAPTSRVRSSFFLLLIRPVLPLLLPAPFDQALDEGGLRIRVLLRSSRYRVPVTYFKCRLIFVGMNAGGCREHVMC